MRILTAKIIAHTLISCCAFIMLYFTLEVVSGINQYIFGGLIVLIFVLANIWIAVLSEYDYQGNP